MRPRRWLQKEQIVDQSNNIEDLVGKKDLPAFNAIRRIVESDHC